MVKPTNTDAIAAGTGRPWDQWVELLEQAGARTMNHTAIAALALDLMPASASQQEWWAQSTAVAFEQYTGLRVPGQTSTGDFQVSTTRTINGDMDAALQVWMALVANRSEFGGVPIESPPTTSQTDRWRYWRVRLTDGSRVVVNIRNKTSEKAALALEHSKLDSAEAIEYWRPLWKELLAKV